MIKLEGQQTWGTSNQRANFQQTESCFEAELVFQSLKSRAVNWGSLGSTYPLWFCPWVPPLMRFRWFQTLNTLKLYATAPAPLSNPSCLTVFTPLSHFCLYILSARQQIAIISAYFTIIAINSVIYSRLGFFVIPYEIFAAQVVSYFEYCVAWCPTSSTNVTVDFYQTDVASSALKQQGHRQQIRCVSIYHEIAQTEIANRKYM